MRAVRARERSPSFCLSIDIKVGSMPHTWALGHVGLTALLSFFPLSGNMLLGLEEGYLQDLL